MIRHLIISIRLLDNRFHGRIERGREPEWPPSPMRLFQSLLACAAPRWVASDVRDRERPAFEWLERQPAPVLVAPAARRGSTLLTYVPNNNRGGKDEPFEKARTPKLIEPMIMGDDRHIEFHYALAPADGDADLHANVLCRVARHVQRIGWGIDLAIGNGVIGSITESSTGNGRQRYLPTSGLAVGIALRTPKPGTLASLEAVHAGKLARFAEAGTLTLDNRQPEFATVTYATSTSRPAVAFRFIDEDSEDDVAYSTDHLKEIAGRLRHVAAEVCRGHFDDAIIEGTINGHPKEAPRLSILPLPSIGHRHVDGRVRRVIFTEAVGGDGAIVRHMRNALDDHPMIFEGDCDCPPSQLVSLPPGDSVLRRYTNPAMTWTSVTPVLLPGHDNRRGDDRATSMMRASSLIAKALTQAGIDTPCRFEFDRVSYWPGTQHVRNYHPREKLENLPRYHVRIQFDEDVTGPISIGAGRHVGFGTLAATDGSDSRS